MPISPRMAGGGFFDIAQPLFLAGTGWVDNLELGFPTGANAIPASPATVSSNALLVSGLNSFMFLANLSGDYNILVSHCDPTTDVALITQQVRAGIPGAASTTNPTTMGAFSSGPGYGLGHVWMVIRVVLSGSGAARTLTDIRMWCGTR